MDDVALLDAWARGDAQAGRALFERHAGELAAFVARKLDDDAGDLVHEAFAACLAAARAGRDIAHVRGYLFRCARNALVDRLAARARVAFDPQLDSLHDLGTSPSVHVARDEERRLLHEALRRLALDDQLALELYYWHELPVDELALALGVGRSAALSRLHRARGRLRGAMEALPAGAGEIDRSLGTLDRPLPPDEPPEAT